jgi:hypothetical protein
MSLTKTFGGLLMLFCLAMAPARLAGQDSEPSIDPRVALFPT